MNLKTNILLLIWDRIKKEPYIWILLIMCLYIVAAYYFRQIRIPSSYSIKTTESINSIAYTLSLSYISGMIFYILSVFLSHIRKTRSVLKNIVEDLRLFKDHFMSLLSIFNMGDLNGENAYEKMFEEIARFEYSKDSTNNPIKIESSLVSILKEYVREFDSYLRSIMAADEYLTADEYSQLTEIRSSYSFSQIRIHFDEENDTYYNSEGLMRFIRDLIGVKKKVDFLHEKLSKYGYGKCR